jgi:aryl-alcohol dehydrogenase-like predicted oxidoreductase
LAIYGKGVKYFLEMKYRTLGKTGLKVSEVGMGTWQLANDPNCWVGADLKESYKSIFKFVELGGNFIDTAWIYGYDDKKPGEHPSEQMIGRFLKEHGGRDKLVVATKVPPKNMKWPAWKKHPISEVFPNNWIEKCVNNSLKSLGVSYIDLVQFHVWQDDFVKSDGWKETITKIMKSGKVRYWGISANDYQPSNCLKACDTGLISTIQFIFNLFHQRPAEKLLPYAKKNNIGLIARVPLDEGGLTGKFTESTTFADGDFRQKYFTKDRLGELVKRNNSLKKLTDGEAKSLMDLDLRYLLSWNEMSSVIPGMRRIKYVEENTSVSDGRKLSKKLLQEFKEYSWERNFYPNYDPSMKSTDYIEL